MKCNDKDDGDGDDVNNYGDDSGGNDDDIK